MLFSLPRLSVSECVLGRPPLQDEVSARHRAGLLGMGSKKLFRSCILPMKWGEPSPRGAPCQEDTGLPSGKRVVVVFNDVAAVECYVYLLHDYC